MDYMEYLADNQSDISEGVLQFISTKYPNIFFVKNEILELYCIAKNLFSDKWDKKIKNNHKDWVLIQNKSKTILSKLEVLDTHNLKKYEDKIYDSSFPNWP